MDLVMDILTRSWHLLLDSAVYILFGILVGGLLKTFLDPGFVSRHLGKGRFSSVLKAALLGVPLPLCSCGVLPAAASLKKQGANNGATAAFLISTPESGVDSIAISYALLDPLMTIVRPIAGAITAIAAGITENLVARPDETTPQTTQTCTDGCCDGAECSEDIPRKRRTVGNRLVAGLRYAFGDLWADLAGWFFVGVLLAGLITALIPVEIMGQYLGGGISSMLLMLVIGIPIYICATASTPIAAAFILQGVSPGTALVFLLAGPATNVTSLTVLLGVLGKRATAIYLASIAVGSVVFGLGVDAIYSGLGVSAQATIGQSAELIPDWMKIVGVTILLGISVEPLFRTIRRRFTTRSHGNGPTRESGQQPSCEGGDITCAESDPVSSTDLEPVNR
jgi:uncharacterized protein